MEKAEKRFIVEKITEHLLYYNDLVKKSKELGQSIESKTDEIFGSDKGVLQKEDFLELNLLNKDYMLVQSEFIKAVTRIGLLYDVAKAYGVDADMNEEGKSRMQEITSNPNSDFLLIRDGSTLVYKNKIMRESVEMIAEKECDVDLSALYETLKQEYLISKAQKENAKAAKKAEG